ncbi:hypothetical protein [Streptomyces sp. NPDC004682]
MPADEARGTGVEESRARTGPRHAAPKKPLFTRFHMPAGKAIASVAMPTAVIMGMGFTSTLAIADSTGSSPASNSQKAADYKDCVDALDGGEDSASPSATPSAGASTAPSATTAPSPSATSGAQDGSGNASSPDSGSDGKAGTGKGGSADSGSSGAGSGTSGASGASGSGTSGAASGSGTSATTPAPSKSADGGLLGSLGDAIGDVLSGGKKSDGATTPAPAASSSTPAPAPSATSSAPAGGADKSDGDKSGTSGGGASTKKAPRTVQDTLEKVAGATRTPSATETPSADPSASESAAPDDCPTATDDQGGVDNKVPVADDPWYLNASSLLLKGADYKGVVEVRTANGTTKKVLKYVISGGTDIGDLHQTVKDKQAGKTYHVQAAKGSTSTIRDGDTVMYTESISGNLFGLIPVTFSPDSPPPLNIPLIYFTDAKVTQAGQFGGSLHVPGMHVYTTD